MKKLLAASSIILGLILNLNSLAFADSIAVVDVAKVVASSNQVKALKAEQQKKNQELKKWLDTAKADIDKQSTEANKQKLIKKYEADLNKKKEAIQKEYAKKLSETEKSINSTIAECAKNMGYTMVITKSVVLYGGNDITNDIIKTVK